MAISSSAPVLLWTMRMAPCLMWLRCPHYVADTLRGQERIGEPLARAKRPPALTLGNLL
jgi:hypothetical protein